MRSDSVVKMMLPILLIACLMTPVAAFDLDPGDGGGVSSLVGIGRG